MLHNLNRIKPLVLNKLKAENISICDNWQAIQAAFSGVVMPSLCISAAHYFKYGKHPKQDNDILFEPIDEKKE